MYDIDRDVILVFFRGRLKVFVILFTTQSRSKLFPLFEADKRTLSSKSGKFISSKMFEIFQTTMPKTTGGQLPTQTEKV